VIAVRPQGRDIDAIRPLQTASVYVKHSVSRLYPFFRSGFCRAFSRLSPAFCHVNCRVLPCVLPCAAMCTAVFSAVLWAAQEYGAESDGLSPLQTSPGQNL
jgi:hypothetical protein